MMIESKPNSLKSQLTWKLLDNFFGEWRKR